jgi:hypothetical protein
LVAQQHAQGDGPFTTTEVNGSIGGQLTFRCFG